MYLIFEMLMLVVKVIFLISTVQFFLGKDSLLEKGVNRKVNNDAADK